MTQQTPSTSLRSPSVESRNKEIESLKMDLLQNYLNGSLILGTIIFFINLYIAIKQKSALSAGLTFLLFSVLFVITFVRKINPQVRTILLSVVFLGAGIFSLISSGLHANGILYLFMSVLILGLLGHTSWWIVGLSVSVITTVTIGVLVQVGVLRHGSFIIETNSLLYWIFTFVIFLFLIYLILQPTNKYLLSLFDKLRESHKLESSLRDDHDSVLDRVKALESELERRRSHLISGRQIGRSISEKSTTKELMQEAADLIQSQFGYYYCGIYLTDDFDEYAVLHAATGNTGRDLLTRNYKIRIRDEGFVGFVISRGEPRIALNVVDDIVYSQDSNLPNTQSEIALPLRIGDRIFGAIDIHSDKLNAFSQEDTDILQTITDQVASAIEKSRQIESLQASLSELESAYSIYSQTSWRSHLQGSKKNLSFKYSDDLLDKKDALYDQEMEVIQSGQKSIISASGSNSDSPESTMLIPLLLRNQTLGVLNIKYKGDYIPPELEELVETISSRLAVAVENARLLEDIQEHAEREKVVGTISSKVRAAKDIDSILQTTASELGRFLGVDEIRVHLKTRDSEN